MIEFKLPNLGENIEGGEVVSLLVQVGEDVQSDQNVIELETDKAIVEVPINFSGKIKSFEIEVGDKIKVGDLILTIDGDEEKFSSDKKEKKSPVKKIEKIKDNDSKKNKTSPSMRKRAYEVGLDLSQSGNIESLSNMRIQIAKRMQESWQSIPQVTQFEEADLKNLFLYKERISQTQKISFTALIIKVLGSALKEFPKFRAELILEQEKVIYHENINIGVAVDTEHGLIVPVIKNVDQKEVFQISEELIDLAEKAKNRKISLEDLQGGVFTLSNLGSIATTYFTPIIFPPQVAILGIGRVLNSGFLPLSLTYDHRWIDGADAARFLKYLIDAIEKI